MANNNVLLNDTYNLQLIIKSLNQIYSQHKKSPSTDSLLKIKDIFKTLHLDTSLAPSLEELNLWTKEISSHFVVNVMDRFCKKEEFAPIPQWQQIERNKLSTPIEIDMNNLLKQGNVVSISFCSDVVNNPSYSKSAYNEICNEHYAVAVAQRKNSAGKCEILMMDSQCDHYNKVNPGRCKNGLIWIERKALFNTLKDLVWIPK